MNHTWIAGSCRCFPVTPRLGHATRSDGAVSERTLGGLRGRLRRLSRSALRCLWLVLVLSLNVAQASDSPERGRGRDVASALLTRCPHGQHGDRPFSKAHARSARSPPTTSSNRVHVHDCAAMHGPRRTRSTSPKLKKAVRKKHYLATWFPLQLPNIKTDRNWAPSFSQHTHGHTHMHAHARGHAQAHTHACLVLKIFFFYCNVFSFN